MRTVLALIVLLCLVSLGVGQSRQRTRPRTVQRKPAATEKKKPAPPMIGTQVVIVNKNGDRITGTLLDLTAYSVKIRSEGLESTIALDTITTLSFDSSNVPGVRTADPPPGPEFARELDSVVTAFQAMAAAAKPGIDYLDYGNRLVELRSQAELFTARYGSSESPIEAKTAGLLASALTDYTWARTIWTLKLGRASDGTVSEKDSPIVADTLELHPDLRVEAAAGPRFSADKMIAGLWRRASEKAERVRVPVSAK